MTGGADTDWIAYYDAAAPDSPPRPTLTAALDAWGAAPPGHAADLGCGAGRDSLALLRLGWQVTAIDREPEALARVSRLAEAIQGRRLACVQAGLEGLAVPPAMLVNASFALPFCAPAAFPALWQSIHAALPPGGLFAGQVFGNRDSWATTDRGRMNFHARAAVEALAADWNSIMLQEEEFDGATALGLPKHWHLFHLVLQKPTP